ncbi:hypothetical protein CJ205_02185 [Dolosicoccus paucivorans]|uniref:Uncharacterized protein n=1 Tax=Dolosicoccus paucivorans TaxID=84521 RepID=A0A2N6SP95_9LACT|nr:hypothetical protein [Dolosicoccus paucivorans]PMB84884.1 hypothetical protein CJ206_01645 [Dolosicoccus paucivorans]PMC58880.1 hypothetical protein CJ205_02185 [Dolosicoccus paucivorans]
MMDSAYRKYHTVSTTRSRHSNTLTTRIAKQTTSKSFNLFRVKFSKKELICLMSMIGVVVLFIVTNLLWAGDIQKMERSIDALEADAKEHQVETDAMNEEIMKRTSADVLEQAAKEAGMVKDSSRIKEVPTNE